MRIKYISLLYFLLFSFFGFSQDKCDYSIKLKLVNASDLTPIYGVVVKFIEIDKTYLSNQQGYLIIENACEPLAHLEIMSQFYKAKTIKVDLRKQSNLSIKLEELQQELAEVIVQNKLVPKQQVNQLNATQIESQFSGSLAKSLDEIPGVNSIEIGAGSSKPTIRGFSFNRVLVTENGMRHEGQQWGSDHGLEVDALSVEDVEVIKSASALAYGSDAIGGVIKLNTNKAPQDEGLTGSYKLFLRSINNTLTNNINLAYKKENWFAKFKGTLTDYGDYNLPTDTINYLSVNMPVENRRLKNTAGKERNIMFTGGFVSDKFNSALSISRNYFKAGFFPGAHGVPSVTRVVDDGDRRNIELPFQNSTHFKVISQNTWIFKNANLKLNLSYQNNLRQEWSDFNTHYSSQEPPETNADLELEFDLNTYEINLEHNYYHSKKHNLTTGLQLQSQKNAIKGFNFLLPNYDRQMLGAFAIHSIELNKKLEIDYGVRLDIAQLNTEALFDQRLFNYLIFRNNSEEVAIENAQRSETINRDFNNFNFNFSSNYKLNNKLNFELNLGTNFRLPTAIELSSNGIHHGSFRHERGNPELNPEKGYIIDGSANFNNDQVNISFSPYLYYFTNYIYLNPSGIFSKLPHGGQINQYTESKALLTGFEIYYSHQITKRFSSSISLEYLWNTQLRDETEGNFALPFSPPNNALIKLNYNIKDYKSFKDTNLSFITEIAAAQNRTAQNEEATPGYEIFGLNLASRLQLKNFRANINLRVMNMFDTKYFNHTNFYRALEIPEMGRNIQLMLSIPF